jgi:hypothetical protein
MPGFLDVLSFDRPKAPEPDYDPPYVPPQPIDLRRLGQLHDLKFQARLIASDRVLYVDSIQVPENRRWLVPIASAWFTAIGPLTMRTAFSWALCDPSNTPRSEVFNPPPALIADTASTFDTKNRPFPITLSQDSFSRSPDGTSIYGISTIGGLHNQELKVPPGWFLRAIVNRNDAPGPFMPAGTVLEMNLQVIEENERALCL